MPRLKTAADGVRASGRSVLYRTANLNFATYLCATGRLTFDHVKPHEKYSEFYFRDPEEAGSSIWTEYCTKDLQYRPSCCWRLALLC
jgi:hypothetical protein